VIANGAECEPLLHKDGRRHGALCPPARARLALRHGETVGASDGVIAIKAKNKHAVETVEQACRHQGSIEVARRLYPAGDEYDWFHGHRPPHPARRHSDPGRRPWSTMSRPLSTWLAAAEGRPLTPQDPHHRRRRARNPPRSSCRSAPRFATASPPWWARHDDPVLCLGGMMMGRDTDNLDTPVTKTSTA